MPTAEGHIREICSSLRLVPFSALGESHFKRRMKMVPESNRPASAGLEGSAEGGGGWSPIRSGMGADTKGQHRPCCCSAQSSFCSSQTRALFCKMTAG